MTSVIKIDIIIKQDGGWLISFVFNILETKYVTKKLTTDVTITSKVFINNPIKNILPFSFKTQFVSFRGSWASVIR